MVVTAPSLAVICDLPFSMNTRMRVGNGRTPPPIAEVVMLLMVEGGGWEDSIANSRGGDAIGDGVLGEGKAPPPIAEVVMLLVVEG